MQNYSEENIPFSTKLRIQVIPKKNTLNPQSKVYIIYLQRLIFAYCNILQNFIQRGKIFKNHPPSPNFQIFRILKNTKM